MAKQTIGIGSSANDGTGDTLRDGAVKLNANFDELYQKLGNNSDVEPTKCVKQNNIHVKQNTLNKCVRMREYSCETQPTMPI